MGAEDLDGVSGKAKLFLKYDDYIDSVNTRVTTLIAEMSVNNAPLLEEAAIGRLSAELTHIPPTDSDPALVELALLESNSKRLSAAIDKNFKAVKAIKYMLETEEDPTRRQFLKGMKTTIKNNTILLESALLMNKQETMQKGREVFAKTHDDLNKAAKSATFSRDDHSSSFKANKMANVSRANDFKSKLTGIFGTDNTKDMNMTVLSNQLEDILAKFEGADLNSTAEEFIAKTFTPESRKNVGKIDQVEVGKLQRILLQDMFTVSNIRRVDGAIIYNGNIDRAFNTDTFVANLTQRLEVNNLNYTYNFAILDDEMYITAGADLLQYIITSKTSLALVIYSQRCNLSASMIADFPLKAARNALAGVAFGTTVGFALSVSQLIGVNGDAFNLQSTMDTIMSTFIPMVLATYFINSVGEILEKTLADMKGIVLDTVRIPSATLFNFGFRSVLLSIPKSNKDLFDVTFSSWLGGFLLSLGFLVYGLMATQVSSKEVLDTFPSIPFSYFQVNALVRQLVNGILPNAFATIPGEIERAIHVHWAAIVGAAGFIVHVLQLLPILDSSPGSKLTLAALGNESFTIIRITLSLFQLAFWITSAFSMNDGPIFSIDKLLLEFFLILRFSGINLVRTLMDIRCLIEF
jgi:hypothetical protein